MTRVSEAKRFAELRCVQVGKTHSGMLFLSPGHWKDWIMLAKGKAPKVRSAGRKVRSRYATFPRGAVLRTLFKGPVTRPVRAF